MVWASAGTVRADEAIGEPPASRPGWATAQASELTRQGHDHAANHDRETAARRYLDALKFDPTYGSAYLALGELYEASGDEREAERTYSTGIDHVTGFAAGYEARARLRTRHGRPSEAVADLEAAVAVEPDWIATLHKLAAAYVTARALPAALAVERRIAALAHADGDTRAHSEARAAERALSMIVAEADPVSAGRAGRGAVRRAIGVGASKSGLAPRRAGAKRR